MLNITKECVRKNLKIGDIVRHNSPTTERDARTGKVSVSYCEGKTELVVGILDAGGENDFDSFYAYLMDDKGKVDRKHVGWFGGRSCRITIIA